MDGVKFFSENVRIFGDDIIKKIKEYDKKYLCIAQQIILCSVLVIIV